jgi:hypothetical protein
MLCEVESLLILDNIVVLLENDVNEATNMLVTHLQRFAKNLVYCVIISKVVAYKLCM